MSEAGIDISKPPLSPPNRTSLHTFLTSLQKEIRRESGSDNGRNAYDGPRQSSSVSDRKQPMKEPLSAGFVTEASIARLVAIVERPPYMKDGNGRVGRAVLVPSDLEEKDKKEFMREWVQFKSIITRTGILRKQEGVRVALLVGRVARSVGLDSGGLGEGLSDSGLIASPNPSPDVVPESNAVDSVDPWTLTGSQSLPSPEIAWPAIKEPFEQPKSRPDPPEAQISEEHHNDDNHESEDLCSNSFAPEGG